MLDLPSVVQNTSSAVDDPQWVGNGGLLTLDDDTGAFIPHPRTQITKLWLSSVGGVGCFAANMYQDMLGEVAKGTGTDITVLDELKGLQVSGGRENDVDDALAKLTRIEAPLVPKSNPSKFAFLTHILVAS